MPYIYKFLVHTVCLLHTTALFRPVKERQKNTQICDKIGQTFALSMLPPPVVTVVTAMGFIGLSAVLLTP